MTSTKHHIRTGYLPSSLLLLGVLIFLDGTRSSQLLSSSKTTIHAFQCSPLLRAGVARNDKQEHFVHGMFSGKGGKGEKNDDTEDDTCTGTATIGSPNYARGGIAGGLQQKQQSANVLERVVNSKNNNSNQSNEAYSMNEMMDILESTSSASLPLDFQLLEQPKKSSFINPPTSSTQNVRTLRIRQMELSDLQTCVSMCLQEYGKYSKERKSWFESKMDDVDNFVFSFVVLLGLEQRVMRRIQSDTISSSSAAVAANDVQDHNVILISEMIKDDNGNEKEVVFGMAELSLQPPEPSRTSPPFVIPTNLKSIFYQFTSPPSTAITTTKTNGGQSSSLCAYISNVLISPTYRSKGYSKLLMSILHGIAKKSWFYNECYLHVDADAKSGRSAQQLYRKLGYKVYYKDEDSMNDPFTWMNTIGSSDIGRGGGSNFRGLYIVDGVPLLFLKKEL